MLQPDVVVQPEILSPAHQLAANVLWLRLELKWSTRALAEQSKLSLSTLYAVEHPANSTVRLRTIEKLAHGFGVTPAVLVSTKRVIQPARAGSSADELVALNLKRFRNERALSQVALAQGSGIARHLITKLETGAHLNPTLLTLHQLADALGVTLEDMLAGD